MVTKYISTCYILQIKTESRHKSRGRIAFQIIRVENEIQQFKLKYMITQLRKYFQEQKKDLLNTTNQE